MDERLRTHAKNQTLHFKGVNNYQEAISLYLRIESKNDNDYRAIAGAYVRMAIIYFNRRNYNDAAQCYLESTRFLQQQSVLDDWTYRELTQCYIDLSDAFTELCNHQAGNEAINSAIQTFNLIKEKNTDELHIGNPRTNFTKFHEYFESQSSESSYIKSTKFKNNQRILLDRQLDGTLLEDFHEISVNELKQLDEQTKSLVQHLLEAEPPQRPSFFNSDAVLREKQTNSAYRRAAKEYLALVDSYLKNGTMSNVIISYRQAKEALMNIEHPCVQDCSAIERLNNLINSLKDKTLQSIATLPRPSELVMDEDEYMDMDECALTYSDDEEEMDTEDAAMSYAL